jgi:hypothetical protein
MPGLRVLTLAPTVWEHAGQLHARTSLILRLLTLGSFSRHVTVDRKARWVTITRRRLWMTKLRLIPFRHVHRIDYEFHRTVTSISVRGGDVHTGDELESFLVSLVLHTRENVPASHAHLEEEHVPLFMFSGEGRGTAYMIDFEGEQEDLSRRYVERLREYLGVGVGLGTPQLADKHGQTWKCSACRRVGPPRPGRCYYCGGELEITTSES